MIQRIRIKGYRRFEKLELQPSAGMNIIVGGNESGKSTLLEAISLALTGKVNGKWAAEELNPFWFNSAQVANYFGKYGSAEPVAPPEILIELYFGDSDELQKLRGAHNTMQFDCPGVRMRITPSEDYAEEFGEYMADSPPVILPVEFYRIEWRDFSDQIMTQRPKALATSFIDARTIRSTSGVDYHTKEMLSENLNPKERAKISLAHRKSRQEITDNTLKDINIRIAGSNTSLNDKTIGLQMDQSARTSWETGIVPQVDNIPFAMSGQGQQAAVKVSLAMSRTVDRSKFVLIEEPENHLSYMSLVRLLSRIEQLATDDQQLFITTHSSFVLNRLGINSLLLLHDGQTSKVDNISNDTISYFRKLSGYDTLRLILAPKLALVEGPSDAIILERAFKDTVGKFPLEAGIDIVSMGGLTFKRALEVCASLNRQAVAIQDNDDRSREEIEAPLSNLLDNEKRQLLVSDPAKGRTLESQLVAINDEQTLRRILNIRDHANLITWMTNNKTDAAIKIFDVAEKIIYPRYINQAISLLQ